MATTPFNPFLTYSAQLQTLMVKASKQKDPALWLYQNNARTVLFMLESLTRIHDKAFDEKLFTKWYKRYKKLEDLLGKIDDMTAFQKQFKANKKIPKPVLVYVESKLDLYLSECNKRLAEKDWLSGKQLSFDAKLNEYAVVYNKEYASEIMLAIGDEITDIKEFCAERNYAFSQIEEEVHEIRRKLRWLSLYAQCFQGMIQLSKNVKAPKTSLNYLTKDVLNSKYNKLALKPKAVSVIEYDHYSFFALSWIIEELGTLKDSVLPVHELAKAIKKTELLAHDEATLKALSLLGLKPGHEQKVLKQASHDVEVFLQKDKMLDRLLKK